MAALAVFVTFGVVYVGAESIFEDQFKSIGDAMNFAETEHMVSWVGRILFSLVFCYNFLQRYENKSVGEGVRYGLLIGLLLIGLDLDWFGVYQCCLERRHHVVGDRSGRCDRWRRGFGHGLQAQQ